MFQFICPNYTGEHQTPIATYLMFYLHALILAAAVQINTCN